MATLQGEDFWIECPSCQEEVSLRDCELFYLDDFTPEGREIYERYRADIQEQKEELRDRRKAISTISERQARATNVGFILERLAPCLSDFKFACSDCRSIFDPIDYIIFEGLCAGGPVSKIIFADIKTGNGQLSGRQREIREVIAKKRVDFDLYEVTR